MMRQYLGLKEKHPDAVLLFRMGDFYEMFFEDAEIAAKILDLTLTTRDKGKADAIPMAGFPWHAAESYIAKLVRAGHRVAVGEQLTDPAKTKGIVERGVVEIVSPGTAVQDSLIEQKANTYVAALNPGDTHVGLAAADISTGEILLEDLPVEGWQEQVCGLSIQEWILPQDLENAPFAETNGTLLLRRPGWWFDGSRGERELRDQLGVRSLNGFGCQDLTQALGAAGALLHYVREARGGDVQHLLRLKRLGVRDYMQLDATTFRNLELLDPLLPGEVDTSLIAVLDRTRTGMGARAMRAWLQRPLLDPSHIEERHDAVQELVDCPDRARELEDLLSGFRDVDRLLTKVASRKASPRDLVSLGHALDHSLAVKELLATFQMKLWRKQEVPELKPVGRRLLDALAEEPPATLGDGSAFRSGWDQELDSLRKLTTGGKGWIAALQESERERTGIPKLRVGYNRVFGYYLEVGKIHLDKVPEDYIRKQTLANAERYVTAELKEYEEKVLSAEEKLKAREQVLFAELCESVLERIRDIQSYSLTLATLDALQSLASVARAFRYVRPRFADHSMLRLKESRHPVVERLIESQQFVPNDLDFRADQRQIGIITGPNMAGKSTYIRQAGLMAIMAQMGSFVPAAEAEMGVFDRVFTRVGASDSIARGQSTFMVEMEETAAILHGATNRSLVLLDEIGRGTSTYDGLSLAWAVTEYLHQNQDKTPLTLFATHYHELTSLADLCPRVFNLNVEVKEWNDTVIFLHTISPGAADRSYGIHVAELAGIPGAVIDRAKSILETLEAERSPGVRSSNDIQLTLFEPTDTELVRELESLDADSLTPLDALTLIHAWKKRYER